MVNPQDYPMLAPIVEGVVYLFAVMLTTVLAGHLVKLREGYGTTWGSNLFKGHRTLFAAFLVEAVLLSVAFPYIQEVIRSWLWANIAWFPTVVVEGCLAYYVWFCFRFGFDGQIDELDILVPQIVPVLNYLLYYSQVLPAPFSTLE